MRPYFHPADAPELAAPWKILDLCKVYDWPTSAAGEGVIGIIELGGQLGDAGLKDLRDFCVANGIPVPTVDNATGPFASDPQGADVEIALDVQVVAASFFAATGKPAHIRMYWPGNQDIAAAVRLAGTEGCATVSISWGAPESAWGTPALDDMEAAATEATAAGSIIFAASGDNDSSDGATGRANVDAPAACPHVIGCGGTERKEVSQNPDGLEIVWNDEPGKARGTGTGGGFSTHFPVQSWQNGAPSSSGRMVPDLAANAAPKSGYEIIVGGKPIIVGGTSAVAPLMAGLFAAVGGSAKGFVSPILWENHGAFDDIVRGDNGRYRATQGPDPCSGIGRAIGAAVASLFA